MTRSRLFPRRPFDWSTSLGYAIGAAVAGIVANTSGFSAGLTGKTAANVASWLYLAFIPLGLVGCVAGLRLLRQANVASATTED